MERENTDIVNPLNHTKWNKNIWVDAAKIKSSSSSLANRGGFINNVYNFEHEIMTRFAVNYCFTRADAVKLDIADTIVYIYYTY